MNEYWSSATIISSKEETHVSTVKVHVLQKMLVKFQRTETLSTDIDQARKEAQMSLMYNYWMAIVFEANWRKMMGGLFPVNDVCAWYDVIPEYVNIGAEGIDKTHELRSSISLLGKVNIPANNLLAIKMGISMEPVATLEWHAESFFKEDK